MIAGKSVVAFRREDETEIPLAKCFGFVQTYDEKPRRRLWELLRSQGMQGTNRWFSMSDGGRMFAACSSTFIRSASICSTGSTSLCG